MPRSTARVLRDAGYDAHDVRDVGLAGQRDEVIFTRAQETGAIVVSADLGFANILMYSPDSHVGLLVVRVPNSFPTLAVNREILRALSELEGEDVRGAVIIVEPGRTRIRRRRSGR